MIQIMQAVIGLSISVFSLYVNKKKDSRMARILDYYTLACIVLLDLSLIVTFILSYIYLSTIINSVPNLSDDDKKQYKDK